MTDAAIVTQEDLDKLRNSLTSYIDDVSLNVDRLSGWRKSVEADDAFGRIMSGQQWIGGLSMKDGTIEGNKFAANVVVSSLFTTVDPDGPTPTADRWELDTTSFRAYGTVSATPNTKTFELKSTGDVTIGVAPNQLTFVAATGVLTVPAATISGLTIANVASGTVGGTYRTAGAGVFPRMDLSTAGIVAYNGSGTTTFNLDATSGAFTMTGTFTIQGATSLNRVEMKDTGLKFYDSSGTLRSQILNDGSGFIGSTTGLDTAAALSWTTGGAATMKGTVTIGAGKVTDSDGTYWDQNGIVFATTSSTADTVQWRRSGFTPGLTIRGSIGTGSNFTLESSVTPGSNNDSAQVSLLAAGSSTSSAGLSVFTSAGSQTSFELTAGGAANVRVGGTLQLQVQSGKVAIGNQTTRYFDDNATRTRFNGGDLEVTSSGKIIATGLYPGNQTSSGITWNGTNSWIVMGTVVDFGNNVVNFGTTLHTSGGSGGLPSPTKYLAIQSGGTPYYVPVFTAFAAWAA